MAKKWTIEWAVKKYGAVENKNCDCSPNGQVSLGEKMFQAIRSAPGKYFNNDPSNLRELSESEAVRWLVEGQPRIEKKRKWVLDKTEHINGKDADNITFGIRGDAVEMKTVLIRKNGILTVKNYKRQK